MLSPKLQASIGPETQVCEDKWLLGLEVNRQIIDQLNFPNGMEEKPQAVKCSLNDCSTA